MKQKTFCESCTEASPAAEAFEAQFNVAPEISSSRRRLLSTGWAATPSNAPSCSKDVPCKPWEACKWGSCHKKPGFCEDNRHCKTTHECVNHICSMQPASPPSPATTPVTSSPTPPASAQWVPAQNAPEQNPPAQKPSTTDTPLRSPPAQNPPAQKSPAQTPPTQNPSAPAQPPPAQDSSSQSLPATVPTAARFTSAPLPPTAQEQTTSATEEAPAAEEEQPSTAEEEPPAAQEEVLSPAAPEENPFTLICDQHVLRFLSLKTHSHLPATVDFTENVQYGIKRAVHCLKPAQKRQEFVGTRDAAMSHIWLGPLSVDPGLPEDTVLQPVFTPITACIKAEKTRMGAAAELAERLQTVNAARHYRSLPSVIAQDTLASLQLPAENNSTVSSPWDHLEEVATNAERKNGAEQDSSSSV
ncbi:MAG: hypothetical protein FRX49_08796 [Trebouxia sp. A1-2]|nr:MAG: hypothetical protein FRX49_08796 [Trebouxia sp. A1-2]